MKKFIKEFQAFAMRGNVLDLAVGVIIGGAFQGIVTSLTGDIISPLLGLFGGIDFSDMAIELKEGVFFKYGAFITAVLNFIIMAFVIFLLVKGIGKIRSLVEKPKAEVIPSTKKCPYCCTEIALEAKRCPHCTSVLDGHHSEEIL